MVEHIGKPIRVLNSTSVSSAEALHRLEDIAA